MSDLVSRLRDLAERTAMEFDDTTATEAADRIEQLERRVYDLEQAATDPEYAKKNPLGGPARMFDVIADRIRAGEDYHAVLKDYGLDAEAQRDAGRYAYLKQRIEYDDLSDGRTYAHLDWCVEVSSLAPVSLDEAIDAAIKARGA